MLRSTLSLDRLRPVLPGARTRRLLLAAAAAGLFTALALVLSGLSVVGAPISTVTRVTLNVAALGLGLLVYSLLSPVFAQRSHNPLRALWIPLFFALGLLLVFALLPHAIGTGRMDPATGLPTGLVTASLSSGVALLEVTLAAILLLTLRSLILFRRTRRIVLLWRSLLVLMVLAALATAAVLPHRGPPLLSTFFFLPALLLMVYAAFRLSWVGPLPFRRKLAAAGLAAGLVAGLTLMLMQRQGGGAAVMLDGPERIAYGHLFSRSLGDLVTLVFAFGILYGTTAVLSLLFNLPTTQVYAQRTDELRAFRTLAELSTQVLDRGQLTETIAETPVKTGLAQAAWLALVEPQSGSLTPRVVAAEGLTADVAARAADADAFTSAVAERSEPLLLNAAAADHRVRTRPGDGIGSLLVLPLTAGGQTHGALFAARAVTDGFEQEDVGALTTFAGQAALALSHAALFEEALEKERMARELALARAVQQRLLPQHLPDLPGADLAAAEHPALEVAGDYYDVVDLGDGCFGLLVADVAGKGAAAAFYMAELKGIVQSSARLTRSPGAFLAGANEALAPSLGRRAFISAVYAVLDTRAGTLTLARAGHCPVVMARQHGGFWLLRADGLGLGLDDGPIFRRTLFEQEIALAAGDVFALYTDGLVEARSPEGEEFGYDRLAEAVRDHRDRSAEGVLAAVLAAQRGFAGHAPTADDLTALVLKWEGADTPSAGRHAAAEPHGDALPFVIRPAFA